MSQKFHINAKGVPAPCRATKGNCPFGGDDGQENHFDSYEEAQEKADELMEAEYGLLYQEERDMAGGDGWSHKDLEDGTLKAAAQVRLDLEDESNDLDEEGIGIASEVTRDYSRYLRDTDNSNPKTLYEFYESGGDVSEVPSKDSYYEETYDNEGPVGEKWTESSQESYSRAVSDSESANESASMMIEDLEIYSRKMEKTDWDEKGISKNKAMSEFYDYISDVYDNY